MSELWEMLAPRSAFSVDDEGNSGLGELHEEQSNEAPWSPLSAEKVMS
jgi:hypothetical protein